jgi:hypothetical protein
VDGQSGAWAEGVPRWRAWLAAARTFAVSAEPRARPGRRAIVTDIALAALAALASVIAQLATLPDYAHPYRLAHAHSVLLPVPVPVTVPAPGIPLTGFLAIAATTVPLAARRVRPLAAYCIIVLSAMVGHGYLNGVTFLAILFAGYSAVVHSRYRGPPWRKGR